MAGGTAQIPPCPAPPVPGGRIQLLEGGVSLEGLQSSACLSVCACVKGLWATATATAEGLGLLGTRRMSSSGQRHPLVKIKPIVFSIFYVLPLGRPKNEWVVRDSHKVKTLSVDMILKSLKHNLKLNAIHVFLKKHLNERKFWKQHKQFLWKIFTAFWYNLKTWSWNFCF